MGKRVILVIGPNPALQKTMFFNGLELDKVNRALKQQEYTGGKGTNFCRACSQHAVGGISTLLFTFIGGSAGAKAGRLLKGEGIQLCTVTVEDETRTCITCLDEASGTMTELIGPSFPINERAATAMDTAVWGYLQHRDVVGVAILGSLPDGTDADLYRRWVKMAAEKGKPLLVDAVKGISPALSVERNNAILKVNKDELFKMTGKGTIDEAFEHAMCEWPLSILAVTDGPYEAFIQKRGEERCTIKVPALDSVVSPLGAGDTADAVFFSEYLSGTDYVEAFRRGLAAASANCLQQEAARFRKEDYEKCLTTIQVV